MPVHPESTLKATCVFPSPDERERAERVENWHQSGFYRRHIEALQTGPLAWPRPDLHTKAAETLAASGFVVLLGPRGVGKTQMACELALILSLRFGWAPMYLRLSDYFEQLKALFGANTNAAQPSSPGNPRRRASNAALLVLDEAQERYESQFEGHELTRLIDSRYGQKRATIIVANLKPGELSRSLGPSIASRLQEVGLIVECEWPSYRERQMQGAANNQAEGGR